MNKFKKTIFSVFLVALLVLVSGCAKKPSELIMEMNNKEQGNNVSENVKEGDNKQVKIDQEKESEEQKIKRYASLERGTIAPSIDTSNWQRYRNEEYGIEFKYPNDWYWEDYSYWYDNEAMEKIKLPKFGFYLNSHEKGYEYSGDITVGLLLNQEHNGVIEFYEKAINKNIELSDELKIIDSKNGYEILLAYKESAFVPLDSAKLLCNGNIVIIDLHMEMNKKEFKAIIDSLVCF